MVSVIQEVRILNFCSYFYKQKTEIQVNLNFGFSMFTINRR